MQKVDEYQFYRLAKTIRPLAELPDAATTVGNVFGQALTAKNVLASIYSDAFSHPLSVCKPACADLWRLLVEIVPDKFPEIAKGEAAFDFEREIHQWQIAGIKKAVQDFETVLAAECQSLDTYFVSRKLAYDTRIPIDEAERLLPDATRRELPDTAIRDIQQAGRCIAFDIPTAAGFHIVRATETIIRNYYEFAIGNKPKAKMRNWGTYILGGHPKPANGGHLKTGQRT